MPKLSPGEWGEVNPYLDEVLSLPEAERKAWLASFRERNPAQAEFLQSLLDDHRALAREGFLEQSPGMPFGQRAVAGEMIGPYRLQSPLGQGGMGTVWLAERSDGRFERKVAIKFPHIALADRSGAERFQREGSILGRLAHPNIAELVDAGVSADGQPYLVLEYVDGEPIEQYSNRCGLGVEERIRLFLQVLSAVAHAHTNLIVHRDIKPSNVLVRSSGQVKLLDFGIAKLLEEHGRPAEATLLTREGGNVLTPEYAAPEQLTGAPITTATDVYSLGVLLYVLLAGRHPAGPGPHSAADLVKAIVETEPPRLSEIASPSAGSPAASVSGPGSSASNKLRRIFQGDLDTIVAKALKKNPVERYGSVTALAGDLEHYLAHEPISARPDSVSYRTAKYIRRHRVAVAAAAGLVLLLAAFSIAQAMQLRRIKRERDRANRISEFMTSIFKSSDPILAPRGNTTARELLDNASNEIETQLANDPELQAQLLDVMGNSYSSLGLYPHAQALLVRAVDLGKRSLGATAPQTLASADHLAWTLFQQGHFVEAEKLYRETLDAQRRVLGSNHPDTLGTMNDMAATLWAEGRREEAEKLMREALAGQRRVLGADDGRTLGTMDNLAAFLGEEGRLAEAEQLERQTWEIAHRVLGPENLRTLGTVDNLGETLVLMGRDDEAEQLLRPNLEVLLRIVGADHPETALVRYDLGRIAAHRGQRDLAISFVRQAVEHGLSPQMQQSVESDPELKSLHGDPRFAIIAGHARQHASQDGQQPR